MNNKYGTKAFLVILFILGIFTDKISAQNKTACENIVTATVNAINKKTPEQIEKFLAPDFTFSGQKQPLANVVFKQLLKQLDDEITDYKKLDETLKDDELILTYEFNYAQKFGKRTTKFIFNKSDQLKQLDLFTIQVKTMEKGETPVVEKSDNKIITVPLQIKNSLPLVQASLNGINRTFFFDNGSSRLILNSKYFHDEKQNTQSMSSGVQDVNSPISNMDIINIKNFDFYGLKIKESKALVTNLTKIEKKFNDDIYGLIGYEIYKDYDLLFDYANNKIVMIEPAETKKYLETNYAQSKIETLPIEMRGHIPTLKAMIGKKEYFLGFDCGAASNLLDTKFYNSLKKQLSGKNSTLLGGVGESKNVESGNLNELSIGNKKFRNTETVFNDMSHLNTTYNQKLDGLIGYEILSRGKVLLSFKNKQLFFID